MSDVDRFTSALPTDPVAPHLAPVAATEPRPGDVLADRYEVRERLGGGAMGAVFRAFDRKLREDVALKLVRPERLEGPDSGERFLREVRLSRRVTHPNVCRVFDAAEAGALRFFTMELVPGRTLRSRLEAGPIPLDEGLAILEQVCSGVAAAHAEGVVHRDLKPENILLRSDGRAIVADFGVACGCGADGTTGAAGTPAYMAPEQLRGAVAGPQADVFALGLLLREVLSGRHPFGAASPAVVASAILRDGPAPLPAGAAPEDLRLQLQELSARALMKDPARRSISAGELARALAAARAASRGASGAEAGAASVVGADRAAARTRSDGLSAVHRAARARVRYALALGAATALATIALAGLRSAMRPAPAPPPAITAGLAAVPVSEGSRGVTLDGVAVTVEPFSTPSQDPLLTDVARTATERVRAALRAERDVRLIDGVEAPGSGDGWVVRGAALELGPQLRLAAQLVGPRAGAGAPVEVDGPRDDVPGLLARLSDRLVDEARLIAQDERRRARARRGTGNDQARDRLLAYYDLVGPTPGPDHLDRGKRLLDEALAGDPRFVPALVERAWLSANRAAIRGERPDLDVAAADLRAALAIAPADAPARIAACRVERFALAFDPDPSDSAIEAATASCEEALLAAPQDARIRLALAKLADLRCRDERAMDALEQALPLDRTLTGEALSHLVELALQSGRMLVADRMSERLVAFQEEEERLGPTAPSLRAGVAPTQGAHLLRAAVLLREGHAGEARRMLEAALERVARGQGGLETELAALRGLARGAAGAGAPLPRDLQRRLRDLEARLRASAARNPGQAVWVAGALMWTDPEAAAAWLDRSGQPRSCEDAIRRAIVYDVGGRRDAARAALAACRPTTAWQRGCVEATAARLGR